MVVATHHAPAALGGIASFQDFRVHSDAVGEPRPGPKSIRWDVAMEQLNTTDMYIDIDM